MEKVGAYTERATAEGEWRPGNPGTGQEATPMLSTWFNMLQRELVGIVENAGIALDDQNDAQLLEALQSMGLGTAQFQNYSSLRTYETGETCRGSDGHFYEFYDRDGNGSVVGVDPIDPLNRPHVWMRWYGERPGSVIEWRSETLPEGYIENDGSEISRTDYRRVFDAFGTTHGAGDGSTTFLLPDDRGEFKRGWDNGRGVDAGRVLADHQMDQMQQITGSVGQILDGGSSPTGALSKGGAAQFRAASGSVYAFVNLQFDSANSTDARTGASTYPRNNAVIWLTKI